MQGAPNSASAFGITVHTYDKGSSGEVPRIIPTLEFQRHWLCASV